MNHRVGCARSLVVVVAVVVVVVSVIAGGCDAIRWLAMDKPGMDNSTNWSKRVCQKMRKVELVGRQVKTCKLHIPVMPFVAMAAAETKDACQVVFAQRRWNCSSVTTAPEHTPDLTRGSREQSVVHALSAAAVAHSVAKACSSGDLHLCTCGQLPNEPPNGDFKWGGCADNVEFGTSFSRLFVDAPYARRNKKKKARSMNAIAMMNVHNHEAGRKTLETSLTSRCKCHGVSGSCEIKTCWRVLQPLRVIGDKLKMRYGVAMEVVRTRIGTRHQLMPLTARRGLHTEHDLVYIEKSPDYCWPEPETGSVGTRGRFCDETDNGHYGCMSMCCGRPYDSYNVEVVERCKCKYIWCCYVKCEVCKRWEKRNQCL